MTTYEVTVYCRAFSGDGIRNNLLAVDDDGTVRAYDKVAGHYTLCHALSARAQATARRAAKDIRNRRQKGGAS